MFDNVDDTLLAHHAYASHFPQSLAWVVSEYCDSQPWKMMFKGGLQDEKGALPQHLDPETLCEYNAADARLTARAWAAMQKNLAAESAVYEHDKQLASLCREMIIAGIGVDVQRKIELHNACVARRRELKEDMCALLKNPSFSPGKLGEVREALFQRLGGRFLKHTSAGQPSTDNETLEAFQGTDTELAKFARMLLEWRLVGKINSTYIDAVHVNPNTGRTHYNWKPFGTVSGRLSCRLQSAPRYNPKTPEGRIRELYIPRSGHVLVYFDVSQAEMRIAAYLSADPKFMAACGADVHQGNAKTVFPEIAAQGWLDGKDLKDPAKGKPYRDIAKNLGFAINYGAESEKVFSTLRAKGFNISFRAVELILSRLRSNYRVYYKYIESNVAKVRECGFMRTPLLGRIRWLGWYPKPTDVANFPVQSCLADIVNARMIKLAAILPKGADLVAQIHDACIYDVPVSEAGNVERIIKDVWSEPITLAGGPLVLPIDRKRGDRWSELG